MLKYSITNQAVSDLEDIWTYTCKVWSEDKAERYYRAIMSGFEIICTNPKLGREYISIMEDLHGIK